MIVYLLRHAIAVQRDNAGYQDDRQRALTPKGERRMRRGAEGMRALRIAYDLLLCSPYVRAQQTADIVAEVCGLPGKVHPMPELAPDGDPRLVVAALHREHSGCESILLVGHEPYLSTLISTLVTGGGNLDVVMKKGGLCKLSIETLRYGRCATLEWLLTPRQLRRLA